MTQPKKILKLTIKILPLVAGIIKLLKNDKRKITNNGSQSGTSSDS